MEVLYGYKWGHDLKNLEETLHLDELTPDIFSTSGLKTNVTHDS